MHFFFENHFIFWEPVVHNIYYTSTVYVINVLYQYITPWVIMTMSETVSVRTSQKFKSCLCAKILTCNLKVIYGAMDSFNTCFYAIFSIPYIDTVNSVTFLSDFALSKCYIYRCFWKLFMSGRIWIRTDNKS